MGCPHRLPAIMISAL
uniref:Uncharacterized protein n=1 Tax=Anguilla anguilla TaxID=7936 RepID=A0A0E9U2Z6_ANGAN